MSVPVNPLLRDYTSRLLAALGWTGVAMVEFKVNRATGEAVLLEINGRFWGSLPLSSRAGMCFATDLYEMLALGKTPGARSYVSGVRCRKLGDDLDWFKESFRLDPEDRHVKAGIVQKRSVMVLLADLARIFSPAERYDLQVLNDPVPGLWDLWVIAVAQPTMLRRKMTAAVRRCGSAWYRTRSRRQLIKTLRGAERLLFVCYGNIMRSPFASSYLHLRTATNGWTVQAMSAGLYERAGRDADARAIAAGRHWGVDLSSHRSKSIDDELVRWADLILVMDRANLREMHRSYPAAATKTYLLGLLGPPEMHDIEIPDPYAGAEEATEKACGRIAAAVDRLVAYGCGSNHTLGTTNT
jgi:protein-tyrosine-phosphatase